MGLKLAWKSLDIHAKIKKLLEEFANTPKQPNKPK